LGGIRKENYILTNSNQTANGNELDIVHDVNEKEKAIN